MRKIHCDARDGNYTYLGPYLTECGRTVERQGNAMVYSHAAFMSVHKKQGLEAVCIKCLELAVQGDFFDEH